MVDRARSQTIRGWHVYYLQNSRANDAAYVLQQAFTPDNVTAQPSAKGPTTPGLAAQASAGGGAMGGGSRLGGGGLGGIGGGTGSGLGSGGSGTGGLGIVPDLALPRRLPRRRKHRPPIRCWAGSVRKQAASRSPTPCALSRTRTTTRC